jgi:3-oxoacyl-[acyl-carrier protein] reductase
VDTRTDSDLSGRVALVTGGSRGIGAATALRLAEAGADVAVGCGRHREAAEEIAAKITGLGRRAVVVSGDMADPEVPRRIVAETAERLAPVDILVANAGTGPRADLDDVDVAAWDHVMAVNLRAPFLLAQAVVPHMREQRYGRIVLLSSVAAFLGGILSPQYTASKAGLIGLAHSLAATLAPHGITVNAIAPGLIMTDMLAGDPRLETLERGVPVGRLGQPAEVADVIVAVARNAYMTGQTVSVDGGRYPR